MKAVRLREPAGVSALACPLAEAPAAFRAKAAGGLPGRMVLRP